MELVSLLVTSTTDGNSLGDTATLSVVTHLIETQSQVTLQRTFAGPTDDRALWPAIRNRTAAIGFDRYKKFIDGVFHENSPTTLLRGNFGTELIEKHVKKGSLDDLNDQKHRLSIYGPYAYNVLKLPISSLLNPRKPFRIEGADRQSEDF